MKEKIMMPLYIFQQYKYFNIWLDFEDSFYIQFKFIRIYHILLLIFEFSGIY